jgi:hypothetical protein
MLLLLPLACVTSPPPPAVEAPAAVVAPPPPPPAWPEPGSVTAPAVVLPADYTPPVVLVDAGHGAPGNPGNTSVSCAEEQDEMLRLQDHVVVAVAATRRSWRNGQELALAVAIVDVEVGRSPD